MGRPALAIGGVALIGAGVAIAVGWWWPTSEEATYQVVQPVTSVRLDTTSGDVRVTARDVTTTSVHERYHYSGSRPGQAYRLNGGELLLGGCGHDCTVDYEVIVPRNAGVSGGSRSGDVLLDGVAGADVSTNSGDLRVLAAAGPVHADADSGDIDVTLASPQDVKADANSGSVRVVAPGSGYRVVTRTGSGDERISIPTDPAGPHLLDLQADSGDVEVRSA